MKSIKKLFGLLLVAFFAFVLVGCKKPVEQGSSDLETLNEMADKIYLGDKSEVTGDFTLPKYAFGNKEFTVTWESSDTAVIEVKEYTNDDAELYYHASVVMALEVKNVVLTATVKYKDLSVERTYNVTVLADEYENFETIAAVKATEGKEKDVSKVKFQGTVSFTTGSGYGVTDESGSIYCYGSNHGRTVGEIVEVRGVWTYYNNMVQLATGSTAKVLGTDANFAVANIAEEKSISEIAAIEAKTIDPENCTRIFKVKFAAKANAAGSYNTYKLVDPLDSSKFVDVSKYNDATTLTEVGELAATEKFYEGIVIIYCSRSGTNGLWDVLYVPGSAVETEITLTDEQKVASVVTELKDAFEGMTVKENLELPTSNANGATISWASDKEEVISAAGVYVAPSAKTEVKLTATITLNDVVQTVEITVTAKAKGVTVATLVTAPEVGVAYKLGINQKGLGKMLFATGAMSGYYGATTEDHSESIDVYLETAEGGYYVYTTIAGAKKYICAVISGTHINFTYADAPNVAWVYNTEFNTITCTVDEKEVFIGTRGTYNTIGGYSTNELAADYPVNFYKEEAKLPYATTPEVGVAYKLGIDQQGLDKVLYATGAMSGYYGATTEAQAEAVDVYLETAEGGYYVTATIEGAKKYICAVISGTHINFTYADAPNVAWVYNAEFNTITCTVEGKEVFIGTRGTYNTIGGYSAEELAADYPVHFYFVEENNQEQPPVVTPTEKEETIANILAAAANLEHQAKLEGKYKVTGKVTEVTDAYSEQYKNVTFVITDGTNTLECYRAKGDEAANVVAGDTVVLVGEVQKYNEKIQLVYAEIQSRKAEAAASGIASILEQAASLGDKEFLEGEFTVTGKVTEVTDGYSEQYKNISFKLSDGAEILCYRAKGDEAANVAVGDTITLTGKVQNYGGTIELVQAVISERIPGEGTPDKPEVPAEKGDATIELIEANRTVGTTEQNVYVANGITITNDKAASTTNVRQDADHARFYAHTSLKIEYTEKISKIVITATGSGYILTADTTLEGATFTVEGTVITITLTTPANSFSIADLGKQLRAKTIEIFVAK